MADRKIIHALATYLVEGDEGRRRIETAFRGQVVDIPDIDDQLRRLDGLGATAPGGVELKRAGKLYELPIHPTDEELNAWVVEATTEEVRQLKATRPDMVERVAGAQELAERARERHNRRLAGGNTRGEPAAATDDLDEVETETDLDELVKGNVEQVARYISEHPHEANAVLRAEARGREEPRIGVVRAAEAAVAHVSG